MLSCFLLSFIVSGQQPYSPAEFEYAYKTAYLKVGAEAIKQVRLLQVEIEQSTCDQDLKNKLIHSLNAMGDGLRDSYNLIYFARAGDIGFIYSPTQTAKRDQEDLDKIRDEFNRLR